MQITLESPIAARGAIMTYLNTVSPERAAAIIEYANTPSPIEAIAMTAEYLYANRDDLDAAGRDLCGSLASYCAQHYLFGFADDQRGARIALAMRRDNGEDGTFPDAESDPAPHPRFGGSVAPFDLPPPPIE